MLNANTAIDFFSDELSYLISNAWYLFSGTIYKIPYFEILNNNFGNQYMNNSFRIVKHLYYAPDPRHNML